MAHRSFDAVHVQGAANIAKAAAKLGVRSGSCICQPWVPMRNREAAYARSKAAGEAAVHEAFPAASIVRPSIVFGPGDAFFNRFAAMAQLSPALPLIGGGATRFQPVYVGDVARAMAACLEGPGHAGETFDLGGPRVYSFKELLEMMLRETKRQRLLIPVPFALATLKAAFLEYWPVPPITRDQVKLLKQDNVVPEGAKGLADLGIDATPVESILPLYMDCYRDGGRYEAASPA